MLLASRLNAPVSEDFLGWATKTKKRGLTVLGLVHTLVYTACRRFGVVTEDQYKLDRQKFLELCAGKMPAVLFCPVRWLAATVAKNWGGASSIRIINENLDALKEFGLLSFEKSRFGKVDNRSVDPKTGEVVYRASPRAFQDLNLILLLESLVCLRKRLVESFGGEILPTRGDNVIDLYNIMIAPLRGYFQHDSVRDIEDAFADKHTILEPHIKGEAITFLSEMVACVEGKPSQLNRSDPREPQHFSGPTGFGRYLISEGIGLEYGEQAEAQDSFIEFATNNYVLHSAGKARGLRKVLLDAAHQFNPFKRALAARACRMRLERDKEYFENTIHAWLLTNPEVIQRWQERSPRATSLTKEAGLTKTAIERQREIEALREYMERRRSGEDMPDFQTFYLDWKPRVEESDAIQKEEEFDDDDLGDDNFEDLPPLPTVGEVIAARGLSGILGGIGISSAQPPQNTCSSEERQCPDALVMPIPSHTNLREAPLADDGGASGRNFLMIFRKLFMENILRDADPVSCSWMQNFKKTILKNNFSWDLVKEVCPELTPYLNL